MSALPKGEKLTAKLFCADGRVLVVSAMTHMFVWPTMHRKSGTMQICLAIGMIQYVKEVLDIAMNGTRFRLDHLFYYAPVHR